MSLFPENCSSQLSPFLNILQVDVFSLISKFHIIDLAHQLSFLQKVFQNFGSVINAAIFLSILMPAIKLQIHDTVNHVVN